MRNADRWTYGIDLNSKVKDHRVHSAFRGCFIASALEHIAYETGTWNSVLLERQSSDMI